MPKRVAVGDYLIQRLQDYGVNHVFGVPGDYVLGFYDQMVASPLEVVGTCTEAGAGFAADAYARVNGLGVVCITYCVGGFNALNSVAGAYAEKAPLVVISGAPGMDERATSPLLHHRVRDFQTQHQIFEKVTVASTALENPEEAPREIDRVLEACVSQKRPVYIEIPRDMTSRLCAAPTPLKRVRQKSNSAALAEAVAEAAAMLKAAKRPVILGGVEIHRFGLQKAFLDLAERTGYPIAATLLGKSIIRESHPQYLGIYEGAMGREDVQKVVERADCTLILGAFMTDINLGIYTAQLDVGNTVNATSDRIGIKHHNYVDVTLNDFIKGLAKVAPKAKKPARIAKKTRRPYKARPGNAITVARLFDRMNDFLTANTTVICDIGDSLFGAADLTIHRRTEFLSPAYYTSMGYAVPAALGAEMNKRNRRPVVFVGDGAFQMTGMELSTIARHKLNPIVFVLNNKGYSTERFINDGPYNDILNWEFHRIPELLNAGWGCEVRTEGDLEDALDHVSKHARGFSIVNVHLDPFDASEAMSRLGKRLGKRIAAKK